MAVHTGKEGTVKVGANAIAEIRNYSYEEVGDTVETTALGDTARTFEATLTSWTGSVDVWYDETDTTGQGNLTVGSEITVVLKQFKQNLFSALFTFQRQNHLPAWP